MKFSIELGQLTCNAAATVRKIISCSLLTNLDILLNATYGWYKHLTCHN